MRLDQSPIIPLALDLPSTIWLLALEPPTRLLTPVKSEESQRSVEPNRRAAESRSTITGNAIAGDRS